VALVIGNDRYQHVRQLERAVSDAQAVGVVLRQLGFEVLVHSNLDRGGMIDAIGGLVDRIARGGVGVLFFAGHGVHLGGENFLLPIEVKAARADDVPDKAIALGRVMERLAQAQAKFTLLILDACRDNPFPKVAGRTIGGTSGLTIPAAPDGLMVIFSAGINQQAVDRLSAHDPNPNGLFTREFLKYLPQPGLRVDDMLKRVRSAVLSQAAAIGHQQNPAIYDQSSGDFYFVVKDTAAHPDATVPPRFQPATTGGNDDAVEITFWNSVKDDKTPDAFQTYLTSYPQGKFAALAQLKLKQLRASSKPEPSPAVIEPSPSSTPPRSSGGMPEAGRLSVPEPQVSWIDKAWDKSHREAWWLLLGNEEEVRRKQEAAKYANYSYGKVLFGSGEAALTPEVKRTLARVLQVLREQPSLHTEVVGHTDGIESRAKLKLSQRRAEAVTAYLVQNGVPRQTITTDWRADRAPVATNADANSRAQNRRVEITIGPVSQ
jgi:outer membrane protein OmpA-like peptidoglycan-associated protein